MAGISSLVLKVLGIAKRDSLHQQSFNNGETIWSRSESGYCQPLMTRAHHRHPRVHKNLFGVMVVQMTVLVVKIYLPHPFLTSQVAYCHSTIKDTYTSGVFDLFLPLKNSGKALLSMAWTLQRKKNTVQQH